LILDGVGVGQLLGDILCDKVEDEFVAIFRGSLIKGGRTVDEEIVVDEVSSSTFMILGDKNSGEI
jgi:hypothetical protein